MDALDWKVLEAEIMTEFDFCKVHKAMVGAGWVWFVDGQARVPTVREIREKARKLLQDCQVEDGNFSTGGFTASQSKPEGLLHLEFMLEAYGAEHKG